MRDGGGKDRLMMSFDKAGKPGVFVMDEQAAKE